MKTNVRIQPSFSDKDKKLDFRLPTSWSELTQDQLRYIARIMCVFKPKVGQAIAWRRLTGIHFRFQDEKGWHCSTKVDKQRIDFILSQEELAQFMDKLKWMREISDTPVRLDEIGDFCAVDAELHEVKFGDYLACENLYQGYLQTSDKDLVMQMAALLYRDKKGNYATGIHLEEEEALTVFLWYAACKNLFSRQFPHFFRLPDEGEEIAEQSGMMERMNAEIRALTGGDITKEQQVLDMDCWRALTELNEKAREAAEFRRKYAK
jgi:hypothetical protein